MRDFLKALLLLSGLVMISVASGCGEHSPTAPDMSPEFVGIEIAPRECDVMLKTGQRFCAAVVDRYGYRHTVPVNWSSARGTVNAYGIYTPPDTVGPDYVTAKFQGFSTTASINVVYTPEIASLELIPESCEIKAFSRTLFRVVARNKGGTIVPAIVSWQVERGSILTNLDYSCTYTAPSQAGLDRLIARVGGAELTGHIRVVPDNVYYMRIQPYYVHIPTLDGLAQFEAKLYDMYGNQITNVRPRWFASAGTIEENGLFHAPGYSVTALIEANVNAVKSRAIAVVGSGGGATLSIEPSMAIIRALGYQQFYAKLDVGAVEVILDQATWAADLGTIDNKGLYRAPDFPTVDTVYCSAAGLSDTVSVMVLP